MTTRVRHQNRVGRALLGGVGPDAAIDWATPPALFEALHAEFGFTLDACRRWGGVLLDAGTGSGTEGAPPVDSPEWGGAAASLPHLQNVREVGAFLGRLDKTV